MGTDSSKWQRNIQYWYLKSDDISFPHAREYQMMKPGIEFILNLFSITRTLNHSLIFTIKTSFSCIDQSSAFKGLNKTSFVSNQMCLFCISTCYTKSYSFNWQIWLCLLVKHVKYDTTKNYNKNIRHWKKIWCGACKMICCAKKQRNRIKKHRWKIIEENYQPSEFEGKHKSFKLTLIFRESQPVIK